MNQIFTFDVVVYPATSNTAHSTNAITTVESSGSTETRARRRMFDRLHASDLMVKQVTLAHVRPAPRSTK